MKTFILIMMMILSLNSMADDVYNFYFQKNGSDSDAAKASETTVASPQPVQQLQKEVKQEKTSEDKIKRMELGLSRSWVLTDVKRTDGYGQTYTDNAMKDSFAVTGSYRFNKYVAADGALYLYTGYSDRNKEYKKLDISKTYDGSLGLSVTPLHLNVFGYELLEVGIIGGVMSMTKLTVKNKQYSQEEIEAGSSRAKKIFTGYIGPRAALNVTKELGIVFDLKVAANMGNITSLGLRYRF